MLLRALATRSLFNHALRRPQAAAALATAAAATPGMFSFGEARFRDRREAGHQLADAIRKDPSLFDAQRRPPICIALPRGGVPVAEQIAKELGSQLDVLIVRKLGAPFHPEYGVGALAEGGVCIVNEQAVRSVGATREQMAEVLRQEWEELERRIAVYRGGAPLVDVKGRVVVVVDDGLATGVSARAAMKALKDVGAARVVLCVPVGSPDTVQDIKRDVGDVICLHQPSMFRAVGMWYEDFTQTEDEEVLQILRRCRAQPEGQAGQAGAAPAQPASAQPAAKDISPAPAPAYAVPKPTKEREVELRDVAGVAGSGSVVLKGTLVVPERCAGLVVFAHGSGSSRMSPRNRMVARVLQDKGMGTLLFDLLSDEEAMDRRNIFNIGLLADRLVHAQKWLRAELGLAEGYPLGFFGASTGGGAAIAAAAQLKGSGVAAVVSRGGRPDLAGDALKECAAPTLLIVGGLDYEVINMNKWALERLPAGRLEIVPGATHLFEEADTLQQASRLARDWFAAHFEQAMQS